MKITNVEEALKTVTIFSGNLQCVPKSLRTLEVCEVAVRQDPNISDVLEDVPPALQRAVIERVVLGAPVIPDIHRAVADAIGERGERLGMSDWHHPCGTVHCRAGWVVALAGPAGAALELEYGTALAASAIYFASDLTMQTIPDFYASHASAVADIKRKALA